MERAPSGKILVVLPSLRGGGAERAAAWLTHEWARDHSVVTAVFNGVAPAYSVAGEILDLRIPGGPGRWGKMVRGLRRVLALRKTVRRLDPDFIFSFMESANLPLLAALLFSPARRRTVISLHGDPAQLGRAHKLGVFLLYRKAGRIVAVSRGAAARLSTLARLPLARIEVIPNPVALEEIARAAGEALDPALTGPRYFFAAGRLVPGKDFARMIRLFAEAACPGVRLLIAGEGPEKKRLQALIERRGVSESVRLLGRVENPFAYMKSAEAFLMTSRHEGFPMVLIEALACGCPFLSADCDYGPREIAAGEACGFVVPPDDDAAFIERLTRLAADPVLRKRMGEAGLRRAAAFDAREVARVWTGERS
ncbi:MAG: pglH [Fibrobacteria bacterium]|jgi:glycosyltransferase involved in cell wall biosynthesis|nr:pglH [Fibrobacteria bacterium]